MANIGATDVTYTIRDRQKIQGRYLVQAQIGFGNTSLTYPSGGIPLTKAKLGLPTQISSLEIIESNGKALLYEWDRSADTIRIFNPTQETDANTNKAGVEYVAATTAPAVTVLEVEAIGF